MKRIFLILSLILPLSGLLFMLRSSTYGAFLSETKESAIIITTPIQVEDMILSEWEFQRGDKSYEEAVKEEFLRTHRILLQQKGLLANDAFDQRLSQLVELENKVRNSSFEVSRDDYLAIRTLKRTIILNAPDIDFTEILCVDNPYTKEPEFTHEVRTRTENTAVFGGSLLVIEGLTPNANIRRLAPEVGQSAAFWRPDLSFDGKKVLYSMRDSLQKTYCLYEIGVDGSEYRQVTHSDYNDFDPLYSPDGNIIFTTSRGNQYLRCGGAGYRVTTLARCDMNGDNIYFISSNVDADLTPAFLPDGRILYTRWEYIDKSVFRVQSLWTVHPDGTNVSSYWGNQSTWPDMLVNARMIPNTQKVVFCGAGHHDIYGGPLGIVNYSEGTNYPDGLYNLTSHIPWAEVGCGPEDYPYNQEFVAPSCYKAFQSPYPISEKLMLVSARRGTAFDTRRDKELPYFDLYLMDFDGNMELIYKGNYNIFHAQPVRSRTPPRIIPSSVKWPGKMVNASHKAEWGTLYSANVYEDSGIPIGMAKYLRILEVEPQTYSDGLHTQYEEKKTFMDEGAFPDYHGYGETVVSLLMDDATKRIWGTVPVEEDGSVNFKVPPVRGIYFQLLDEKGRALQTMRSSTHAMPGEVRGCYGCHATKIQTPKATPRAIALKRTPSEITPPSWGDSTVSFARFVQPVLDRNCIQCHGGQNPKGNLDLTHRTTPNTLITWPYVSLVFGDKPKSMEEWTEKTIAGCIIPYHVYPNEEVKYPTQETVIPPMTTLSYRSKLIEIATSGKHHNVKVTPEEEARLIAWVDALCPMLGLEEIMEQPDMSEEEFVKQRNYNVGLSFSPRMRTAPFIHKEFMQDDFKTQDDRLAKDKEGNELPAFILKNGKREYLLPKKE